MQITNFSDLLSVARNEPHPQLFLFLFAKAEVKKNAFKTSHSSGTIMPVMCVDKPTEELSTFKDLIEEADKISTQWDFIFIGCLNASLDAEAHLTKMSNDVAKGNDLSRYVILDRNEKPIIVA